MLTTVCILCIHHAVVQAVAQMADNFLSLISLLQCSTVPQVRIPIMSELAPILPLAPTISHRNNNNNKVPIILVLCRVSSSTPIITFLPCNMSCTVRRSRTVNAKVHVQGVTTYTSSQGPTILIVIQWVQSHLQQIPAVFTTISVLVQGPTLTILVVVNWNSENGRNANAIFESANLIIATLGSENENLAQVVCIHHRAHIDPGITQSNIILEFTKNTTMKTQGLAALVVVVSIHEFPALGHPDQGPAPLQTMDPPVLVLGVATLMIAREAIGSAQLIPGIRQARRQPSISYTKMVNPNLAIAVAVAGSLLPHNIVNQLIQGEG